MKKETPRAKKTNITNETCFKLGQQTKTNKTKKPVTSGAIRQKKSPTFLLSGFLPTTFAANPSTAEVHRMIFVIRAKMKI